MDWLYLLIAGVFEIGWPVGLRIAQSSEKITGVSIAVVCMAFSGAFLYIVNYYDTGEALKKKEIALCKSSI